MDSKEYLTNKKFCPIPWTGFMYNSNGDILNCIRSQRPIGNLKDHSIHNILKTNTETKQNMLDHKDGLGCHVCYDLEGDKKGYDMISDRIFYLKELKSVDRVLYDDPNNFDLHTIDIRWSNVCNHACVYCSSDYSSKWATELKITTEDPSTERVAELKQLVFDRADQLKHVYMAGGEPLLMKENLELLEILQEKNPQVNLRINTNLSKTDTRVFEKICEFPNVHWTVSVDEMGAEFEYVRYGGVWTDFLDNLNQIRKLDHKITFNMLHHLLNYRSLFDTVKFFKELGFHNNSFVIGALLQPDHLNIRHLPNTMLQSVERELQDWISQKPGFLLENGLRNVLQYIKEPVEKNIEHCLAEIAKMDQRRNINSRAVFTELYNLIERQ
jgi:sulfatase maturation enzyme AslB (radical SAM superfamily)